MSCFCLNIVWADDRVVEVHACTNLANPDWTVLQTLTITNGTAHFSDPDWASHSRRFYRVHPE